MRNLTPRLVPLAVLLLLAACHGRAAADPATKRITHQTVRATALVLSSGGSGSAWVFDRSHRLLVTNQHVVGNDDRVLLFFPLVKGGKVIAEKKAYKDERGVRGKVVDTDVPRDLAVIQLLDPLPEGVGELKLAPASADQSDRVHSIGNPGVSDAFWVYTCGTVRSVYRKQWEHIDPAHKAVLKRQAQVLETQAPLNHGDSGGPVVNDDGEVVAVVSSGRTMDDSGVVQLMSWCIELQEVKEVVASARRLVDPRTAADYAYRGERLAKRGRYAEAIDDFTAALKLDSTLAAAYRGRALAFNATADYDTAIADATEAIRLEPRDGLAYNARGFAYRKKGSPEKAAQDCTRAIQLDPHCALAYDNRGGAYEQQKNLTAALADYGRAVHADPEFVPGYLHRAEVYYRLGEYEKASADGTAALKLDRFLVAAWNVRGCALRAMKDYDGAIDNFTLALKIAPDQAAFYVHRGDAYTAKDQWKPALEDYEAALKCDPRYAPAAYALGNAYEILGALDQAQPHYREAIKLDPKYADTVKVHKTRYLRIVNRRAEPVRVYLHYETCATPKGTWQWLPAPVGKGSPVVLDLAPGKAAYVLHNDAKVEARRVRLWGEGVGAGGAGATFKQDDLVLCGAEGYLAREGADYTYTIAK
jgi:tetratricopeptide (TPR) repeat protein